MAFLAMCVVMPGAAAKAVRIVNFRNDSDLAKAMEYDRELTSDRTQASQALAEKYYLAYLERETESFQRARIYAQLGAIFTNAVDIEAGEKRDMNKGRAYFRKVLEEEPYRLGRCTLQARLNLVRAEPTRVDEVQAQMACYKLLLSLDESTLRSRWLPATPEEQTQGPSGREVEWMLNKVQGHKATAAYNLVSLAASKSTPNREQWLRQIIKRFPGTEAAERAQQKLAELGESRETTQEPADAGSGAPAPSEGRIAKAGERPEQEDAWEAVPADAKLEPLDETIQVSATSINRVKRIGADTWWKTRVTLAGDCVWQMISEITFTPPGGHSPGTPLGWTLGDSPGRFEVHIPMVEATLILEVPGAWETAERQARPMVEVGAELGQAQWRYRYYQQCARLTQTIETWRMTGDREQPPKEDDPGWEQVSVDGFTTDGTKSLPLQGMRRYGRLRWRRRP